jgi:hypothetical protein
MQVGASAPGAHAATVRDVDFARQQDGLVVTAGDDCRLRLWDLRHGPAPVIGFRNKLGCFPSACVRHILLRGLQRMQQRATKLWSAQLAKSSM